MPKLFETSTRVEVAGNKPKLIDEYVGRVDSGEEAASVAHMRSRGDESSRVRRPRSISSLWC
jgi:hypothetical protein